MNVPVRQQERLSAAAIAKLGESGISPEQALTFGMYSVANASLLSAGFDAVPALVLPYFGLDGKPLAAHPKWPAFYRLRYLAEAKGFGDVTAGKKQRYTQPPATGVCAYLALGTAWARLAQDSTEPLLITEGELKAAKACQEGFPTIGLGGVYNFRRSKDGVFFLPELEAFKWARRRVTITYDSDYAEKSDICAAINALAEELQERGALVELATLPDVYDDGAKTGLDDLLVHRGDDALIAAIASAEPLAMSTKLWSMNDAVVYVATPGLIVEQSSGEKQSPANFTAHSAYATLNTPERKVKADGAVSYQKVSAAAAWIKWPLRRAVAHVTYKPGEGRFTTVAGRPCWNQWEGWGCEPIKGDVRPWLKLIEFLFEGADKGFVEWFLDWCAYPLQYPGTKLFSAVMVHGRMTGTGKSLVGYTLGSIYGKNFTKIKNKNLISDFNGWAENRQFVLGDEISGSDKRSEADNMKTTITQEEVEINIKMLPTYFVPDCINYYLTSNHAEALFIEDADRRYGVHEVVHDAPLPLEFYQEYDAWRRGPGPSALFYHLLQRDVSKFNPKGPAFKTAARARMSMHGKSDLAVWCAEMREAPNSYLRVGQLRHTRDLFTSTELMHMYMAANDVPAGKVTANGMARALSAAGFKQAMNGSPVLTPDGRQGRYYVVRNETVWLKCKNTKDLAKHINQPPVRS